MQKDPKQNTLLRFFHSDFFTRDLFNLFGKSALKGLILIERMVLLVDRNPTRPNLAYLKAAARQSEEVGWVNSVIVVMLLAVTVNSNLVAVGKDSMKLPEWIKPLMSMTQIYQKWGMFAPYPLRDDGWFVFDGQLVSGGRVNLLTGEPVSFEKPKSIAATFIDPYWRKYFSNIWQQAWAPYRVHLGWYLCRKWNGRISVDRKPQPGEDPDSDKVREIVIYYMRRLTHSPEEAPHPIEKIWIYSHTCF
jgi:hypothetical protein